MNPQAYLSCLRTSNFNAGSTKVTPLSLPSSGNGLSGGDIAGIVVGSVVGALLIFGLCFWLFRRRRKQRKSYEETAAELDGDGEASRTAELAEKRHTHTEMGDPDFPRQELEADKDVKHELDENPGQGRQLELGSTEIAELPGEEIRRDDEGADRER